MRLAALAALAEAATPGPWENGGDEVYSGERETYQLIARIVGGWAMQEANAPYIAAASPDVVLALLAERDALLAEVDRLTAQHASCCEQNVAAERARIAEAVRELPIAGLHPSEVKGAVLALLEP